MIDFQVFSPEELENLEKEKAKLEKEIGENNYILAARINSIKEKDRELREKEARKEKIKDDIAKLQYNLDAIPWEETLARHEALILEFKDNEERLSNLLLEIEASETYLGVIREEAAKLETEKAKIQKENETNIKDTRLKLSRLRKKIEKLTIDKDKTLEIIAENRQRHNNFKKYSQIITQYNDRKSKTAAR